MPVGTRLGIRERRAQRREAIADARVERGHPGPGQRGDDHAIARVEAALPGACATVRVVGGGEAPARRAQQRHSVLDRAHRGHLGVNRVDAEPIRARHHREVDAAERLLPCERGEVEVVADGRRRSPRSRGHHRMRLGARSRRLTRHRVVLVVHVVEGSVGANPRVLVLVRPVGVVRHDVRGDELDAVLGRRGLKSREKRGLVLFEHQRGGLGPRDQPRAALGRGGGALEQPLVDALHLVDRRVREAGDRRVGADRRDRHGVGRTANAQIPFLEPQKFEELKKDEEKKPEEKKPDEDATPKSYTKPGKRALPEGDAEVRSGPIAVVRFDGIVNPGMGEYTIEAIERAEAENKQAILIELDTPGGLVQTTQQMVKAMQSSKIPIIVYVTPSGAHAASAGTFITLAGHVAAMAPATRIGAAHPVTGSGGDPEEGGKHMAQKENDLVALVEGIARERNRNVEWAKDAVLESVSATSNKALELGVIDLIAQDRADLLQKLDGYQLMVGGTKVELRTKDAPVVEYKPSLRSWLLNFLANPAIAMILGLIGLMGIVVEIKAPGTWIPAAVGVLCILIAAISLEQLPIDTGGVILVLAGLGLIVAEFFTPTHGALGVIGGVVLAIGLVLVIDIGNPDFAIDRRSASPGSTSSRWSPPASPSPSSSPTSRSVPAR